MNRRLDEGSGARGVREMGSVTNDKQEAPAFPDRVAWSDEGFLGWS